LTAAIFEKVARIQFDAVAQIQQLPNVAAVWAVDDIAFGSGPIIKPAYLRKYVFPWYKEMARRCHDAGMFFCFHSDGVLWDVLPDLLEIGVDALHPIDPTCMDIAEVKRRVGDRLCLFGNISNEILMTGTPEEVAALTKQRLREIAPGGGYCVGSGNSVPNWAKFENYMAMRDTVLTYGQYPIRL
jgi:uroporphyrinogen decarboxylase